jgi:Flp pilus assembly protein TadG
MTLSQPSSHHRPPHQRNACAEAGGAARRHPRGQALVEFALALPLFLVLLFGIIDFGRIIAMQSAAVSASREGARYGAAVGDGGTVPYMDCAGIRTAAQRASQALISISDPNQIEISYVDGAGNATTASCAPHGAGPVEADIDPLDRVVVEVTLQYEAITPMVRAMIGPIDVVSTDRRTIVKAGP